MRPVLVGEDNPYGADPRHALYPHPEQSAGGRLCFKVLGLTRQEYMSRFDRVNLCSSNWNMAEAKSTARIISAKYETIVLLGKKVAAAFEFRRLPKPFYVIDIERPYYVFLPHPSGLCRTWHEPGAFERARAVLREAGVL